MLVGGNKGGEERKENDAKRREGLQDNNAKSQRSKHRPSFVQILMFANLKLLPGVVICVH